MNRDDDGNESLGHYEPTPLVKGGQGRSDDELSELGHTISVGCKWFVIVAALVALAAIFGGVL